MKIIRILFLAVFTMIIFYHCKCKTNNTVTDVAEYSIIGYYDTGIDENNLCENRTITLVVKFVNKELFPIFIPIRSVGEAHFCSRLATYYNNQEIKTFISKPQTFKNGIINSNDSIFLELIFHGEDLKKSGIEEDIDGRKLISSIHLRYYLCENDSNYSTYSLEKRIHYIENHSIDQLFPKIKNFQDL